MTTQLQAAQAGKVTETMRSVARSEGVEAAALCRKMAQGVVVIPKNLRRDVRKPCAIGEGLRTKVNANIGTSEDSSSVLEEVRKLREASTLGADAVMDLSTGGRLEITRRKILEESDLPVGTVPIYEIVVRSLRRGGKIRDITVDDFFSVLEAQAADGVDFFTIHAGVTRQVVEDLRAKPRILDIVSRGGAFLAEWMTANDRENPFYEYFDRVIALAQRYDITLSLGDGLRPGSVIDATDSPQVMELATLGALRRRAVGAGVQTIIEGPGHVPLNQIAANVALEKSLCQGAPFYVLGPLVTDVAPGYDHITAAIGGAIAGAAGADFLCYVTPAEHLRLPTLEDVREGVIATRIAAHAADIAKGIPGAIAWDQEISTARSLRDWQRQFDLAIDPKKPRAYRKASMPRENDVCTMCGEYCSIKVSRECLARRP